MSADVLHTNVRGATVMAQMADAILSRDACQALAKKALGYATADETRVSIASGTRGNTRFAVNQVSTSGDNQDTVIAVRSTFGTRSASAVTNGLTDDALRAVVQRAESLARLAPEDPEHVPELGPQEYREAPGYVAATAAMDAAGRAAAVRAVTEPARAAGLVATGSAERRAFSIARAPNVAGLIRVMSLSDAPAQPEPVPSGVRTVVVIAARVCRL